jgi:competence protein ComEA
MSATSPDHPAGEVVVDPNATPWRVLEDEPGSEPEPAPPPVRGLAAIPRSAILAIVAAAGLGVGAFVLAFGAGSAGAVVVEGPSSFEPGASHGPLATAPSGHASGALLVVEIVGAVGHPGVFRLPADARVGDLLAAAGGFGPRVDTGRATRELNLAAPLHDGDQVRVPSRDDASEPPTPTSRAAGGGAATAKPPAVPGGPISLNRATAAELDTLPGVGPATAAKIIASREEKPFVTTQDLRTRKLVGEKTFDKLKALVTVP